MKYVFAGDRDIAVHVLQFMMNEGNMPEALLVSGGDRASHAIELRELSNLPDDKVFEGKEFTLPKSIEVLKAINPDYIIGIHFPYLISKEVLDIPAIGFLNLHPAYLPYNRGWHTPSWAIMDQTPIGATLHFMAEALDAGDIIYQEELIPGPADTANSLYQKLKALELEVFKKAWPQLKSLQPSRIPQDINAGTSYKRKDLFRPEVQELKLENEYRLESLLRKLAALTTNSVEEAAYFSKDGKKYRIQVSITEEDE